MTETMKPTEYIVASDAAPIVAEVAADIGNARTVVLVRTESEPVPVAINMPSVRTLLPVFSYALFADRGLPAGSWSKLSRDEHVIERDGVERFVGKLAAERATAASGGRGSDARYYDGTTLDFILAGVAAALPTARSITVKLTTMIPIALWALAPKVESALRGLHTFRYNGREITIKIASVTVRREGEAAFNALDGDTSGPVVIIDGGGRTVNVALFRDGTYRTGATLELGVQAALDALDVDLVGRGLRCLTLIERGELEAALIVGREYSYICGGSAVRLDGYARIQLDATARALCQELRAKVPIDQARRVVFVGGASYAPLFGTVVRAEIPQVEPSGLRELGNVYGALGAVPVKKAKKR